jgi:hypothetical protein
MIDLASQHQADSNAGSDADDNEIASHAAIPHTQPPATFIHSCSRGIGFYDDGNAVAHPLSIM